VEFKHVHEVLQALFTQQTGQPVSHYEVEHVLDVHLHGTGADQSEAPPSSGTPHASGFETVTPIKLLPESYVPPVIETLSRLASNEPSIVTAAQASGLSIERAFEKTTHTAFTVLGYHTELLGQGKGRVPDGRAEEPDASYIIIWDAKVRADGYSMGTDDRTIREYIATQSRELRRKRSTRNLYYVVVSSTFREDYDDAIRAIKMETDISEVVLLEAAALVEMVNLRLRNPLDVTLGPDGLQRLFASSGIVSADVVRNTIGA
jgi:hypothetical protein